MERVLSGTPEVAAFTRRTGSELEVCFATPQNGGDVLGAAGAAEQALAGAPRRSSPTCGRGCSKVAPTVDIEFSQLLQDMLGDLEGDLRMPIEVKIFGDDTGARSEKLAEPVEAMLEKVGGVVRRRRHAAGQPGNDTADGRSDGSRPLGSPSGQSGPTRRGTASAQSPHRPAAARSHESRGPRRLPDAIALRSEAQLASTLIRSGDRQADSALGIRGARCERRTDSPGRLRENLRSWR